MWGVGVARVRRCSGAEDRLAEPVRRCVVLRDIEIDELAARLGELTVIDVRAAAEYDGVFGAPCDPRQGHVPGAINLHVEEMLVLADDELRARLALPQDAEVVVYCHSGARSALAAQIMTRLGYQVRNYVGSWHEWSRSELPAE
jgi:3-mercaptopyruvate sulfurtransferase SseA